MVQPIIFATGSLPRKNLLSVYQFENPVEFVSSDFNEDLGDKSTISYCLETARGKAHTVYGANPGAIVVGFDTMIMIDKQLIGKPSSREDARSILKLMSGKTHQVITGMVILSDEKSAETTTITNVKFMKLSDTVIDYYLSTLEWEGKAGAYGIQGVGAMMVEKIEGCFYNVVGVPVNVLLHSLLSEFHVKLKK